MPFVEAKSTVMFFDGRPSESRTSTIRGSGREASMVSVTPPPDTSRSEYVRGGSTGPSVHAAVAVRIASSARLNKKGTLGKRRFREKSILTDSFKEG